MGGPPPARLLVVGAGLIGTSIALAARRAWPGTTIVGVDVADDLARRRPEPFDRLFDVEAAVPAHDLAVLACPIDAMPRWLDRLAGGSRTGVVTDVGGVKRAPCRAAAAAGLTAFVGGHPMAGAARPGPALATPTLFAGRPWFVVAGNASDAAVADVLGLVTACGAIPVTIDADEHDRVVAAVSHLPQVVASLLMLVAADHAGADGLAWAGAGLRDTTRLAASPAGIWRPVLAANHDQLAPLLTDLGQRLIDAAGTLDDGDRVTAIFDTAARARERLVTPPV